LSAGLQGADLLIGTHNREEDATGDETFFGHNQSDPTISTA
jgi:hypothetical protein